MDAKKVRAIPNEHSAIYFKEIPAQLAEIKKLLNMNLPSLRDQMAMAAIAACPNWIVDPMETFPETALRCYRMADAMLKAREAGK